MERPTATILRIGAWRVNPVSREISRDGETARIEVRAMRLLMCLAERPGEVVSIDDLLSQAWPGIAVTPDSVYQAVASLRRLLRDDPKQPAYIATVPRLGYRMVATISPWTEESPTAPDAPKNRKRLSGSRLWTGGTLACLAIIAAGWLIYARVSNKSRAALPANTSIAVLLFIDLTAKMAEEEFADGMTEELIDKLSKIPGLRVPPPTASFFFGEIRERSQISPRRWASSIYWMGACARRRIECASRRDWFARRTGTLFGRRPTTVLGGTH